MQRIIAAAPIGVVLLLSACATSPLGRKQLALLPESQVQQMGVQAFAQIERQTPPERDARVNRYVRCVADAITREVGGTWEVAVFQVDTPNAFALPGRKIGVYSGMLQVAENQDQVATVIAHEVAHVLSGHANERISQQFAVEQGLTLIQALGNPTSPTGQTLMGLLGVGADVGILLPYSRVQESEADLFGLDLMANAGFNPEASIALWKNMSRAGGPVPPEFLSTHPSHGTRIIDLQGRMMRASALQKQAQAQGKRPHCEK